MEDKLIYDILNGNKEVVSKLNNYQIPRLIASISDFEVKKEVLDMLLARLHTGQIYDIINSEEEVHKIELIERYQHKLSGFYIEYLVKELSDENKIQVLLKFKYKLTQSNMGAIISSIQDIEYKKVAIYRFFDELGTIEVAEIINNAPEEYRLDLLESYSDKLAAYSISKIAEKLSDDEKKLYIIERYKDKLGGYYIANIIVSMQTNNKLEAVKKHKKDLIADFLMLIIEKTEEKRLDIFLLCHDKFNIFEIVKAIKLIKGKDKFVALEKFINRFYGRDIASIIKSMEPNERIEAVEKYREKLTEANIADIAISLQNYSDEYYRFYEKLGKVLSSTWQRR